jgi:hypothetical protein
MVRYAVPKRSPHANVTLGLDNRTSRRIIRKGSMMMSNLRTKAGKNVGWRYTNQPVEGKRE